MRRFRLIFCCLISLGSLFAAPYGPEGLLTRFTQPDGSTIEVRVFGDECYGRAETLDGYTVIHDRATGSYVYAALSADGNEFISTGKEVGKVDPKALGLGKRLEIHPASRAAKARQRHEEIEAVVQQEARWKALKEANGKWRAFRQKVKEQEKAGKKGFVIPMGTIFPDTEIPAEPSQSSPAPADATADAGTGSEPPPESAPPSFTLSGDVVGLTILVDFADCPGTDVTQAQVDDYFNKPNYTGFANAGSVYDYFYIQSAGNLRYNNNVTYYVRVPNPKTHYNDTSVARNDGICGRRLMNDALDVLIANGYDFSRLSTKSGGYVRACNLFFAGENSGVWASGLWPHRWVLASPKSVGGGKSIYDYQMTNIGSSLKIGTTCHENGHMLLGYPDLYAYDGSAAEIGGYSLMAGGSSGGGGSHPNSIDSYLKEASGWMDVIDLNASSHQRCTLQVDGNQLYRYPNPSRPSEYFLFEVRHNSGWEGPYGGHSTSVNPTAGLVVYHALEGGSNTGSSIFTASNPNCSYATPYEFMIVEANPTTAKTPWYDDPAPDGSDAFKAGGKTAISDATTPELKFWDATGRNTTSNCNINNISAEGNVMSFVIGSPPANPIISLSRSTIDAACNYGQTAPSRTFSLCNGGGATLGYTITTNQTWLSVTPNSGTATTETDTITVDFSTSGLAAGAYTGTITISDPAATPTSRTITVQLTVNARPALAVNPASLTAVGTTGLSGPILPFKLVNTGGGTANYNLSKNQGWLSLSQTSGTILGEEDTIYATCNAAGLAAGTYNDTITITSSEAGNTPIAVPVTYTVLATDMILTSPNGGETWAWNETRAITWGSSLGGTVKIELLKAGVLDSIIAASTVNDGSFDWTLPSGLIPGSDYTVRITSLELPAKLDGSNANFTIINPPIFFTDCEGADPGFTKTGLWEWGTPGGNNAAASAYSGTRMYDTDLDYTCWTSGTLTSGQIDCANYTNVKLEFYANVLISPDYTFKVEIHDGTSWTQLHSATTVYPASWIKHSYNVSAYADRKSNVQVRWSMTWTGPGGGQYTGGGVGIDDIKFTGTYSPAGPEIHVARSGSVPDGTTDSVFGTEAGVGKPLSYVISNVGGSGLSLTTPVTATALSNCSIVVDTQPASAVAASASTNLVLTVTPSALGVWSATVSIANNDADENPCNWTISGTAMQRRTLTYQANAADSGVVPSDPSSPYVPGSAVTVLGNVGGLTRTGYAFAGWNTATNGSGTSYAAGDIFTMPDANVVLYARWNVAPAVNAGPDQAVTLVGTTPPLGWTYAAWTGDADSGISDAYVHTAAHCFGDNVTSVTVNNVPFTGNFATSGTGWSVGGAVTNWNGNDDVVVAGNSEILAQEFIYGGNPRTVTFSGLTVGQTYEAIFYTAGWDATDARNLTFSGAGQTPLVLNQNVYGNNKGVRISCVYQATATSQTLTITPAVSTYTFHLYAMLNRNVATASATVALDGTATDTDGGALSATWSKVAGPSATVTFANANAVDTTATFSAEGIYTLRLTANDTFSTVYDECVITVGAPGSTCAVTYNGNGNSGGSAPTDNGSPYPFGSTVTVLGNTGALVKTGYAFAGWNTAANGSGTAHAPGATFVITSPTTLYAQWAMTYASWASGYYPGNATSQQQAANPDGDSLSNLQEFAFGMDPTIPVTRTLTYIPGGEVIGNGTPIAEWFASRYHAVFARRKHAAAAGLSYTVRFSADMSHWEPGTDTPVLRTGAASSGDIEVVEVPFPESVPLIGGGSAAPKFFKVGVSAN